MVTELLARDWNELAAEERDAFDRLAGGRARRVVLFGAGGLGRRVLAAVRSGGLEPVAFADNDPRKRGTEVDGLPVLSPDEAAARYGRDAAFVVTIWGAGSPHRFRHSLEQLTKLGCEVVLPFPALLWQYRAGLPHYLQDLPHKVVRQRDEVLRAMEIWADPDSRDEYARQVRFRLLADFSAPGAPVPGRAYFRPELWVPHPAEHFVDCGAYDGDSLRDFLADRGARFARVDALEPDPVNAGRLEAMIAALPPEVGTRLHAWRVAAGAAEGFLDFAVTGTVSSTSTTAASGAVTRVRCARLDDLLAGTAPTLIKMDVEGAEVDALAGAEGLIRSARPVLTICVYHAQDHLWRIPLWIRDLGLGYRLHLRPHNEEGWDLVCYAVPEARVPAAARA